ncbi:acetylcholine receptor subunit alpha-like 2 [Ostrea edulis]|uniref:acetylcholine receptor subunit alpha-like 2 n=1 Tax=Ostrea edulis TaxID=37623 RepID=UPI0024AEB8A2|nr:acetylcholine receptor subunit alpha-like 2 [Ostrea edulis]
MEIIGRNLVLLLSIIGSYVKLCYCDTNRTNVNLYNHLLRSSEYDPHFKPVCGTNELSLVKIGVALRNIVDVAEKHQMMRLKIWVYLEWMDCKLKWNPSNFKNLSDLMVPSSHVWVPDITLFEGVSDEGHMPNMEDFRAEIHYTGKIRFNFPSIVTIVCKMNVEYFPFDHQLCTLTFGSWIYSGQYIDLAIKGKDVNLDVADFVEHNEWVVVDMKEVRHNVYYTCCPHPFPDITVYIHMKRKPLFYVVTVIFPCFLINMLTFTAFVLPPFSGEKISLQVTILLSITVFLLLVQDKLPSSSDNFPCIAIYFANSMALVCVSCVLSSIVLYLYYKSPEDDHMSPLFRDFFLNKVRRMLCVNTENDSKSNEIVQTKLLSLEMDQWKHESTTNIKSHHGTKRKTKHGHEKDHHTTDEWELFSYVLNRLFMLVYLCLTMANSFFFAIALISHNDGDEMFRNL